MCFPLAPSVTNLLPTRRRERRLRFWSALLLPAQVSSLKNESRAVRRGGIARKIGNFAILGREDDDERHVGLGLRLGSGRLTHGRARRAGFDGVGVPGLDQYPVCRG